MIPTYLLKRYESQDAKIRTELERLEQWTNTFAMGQPPQTYELAWKKLLRYQEAKPWRTWLKMRSYILGDAKTLWQHFKWVTGPAHLPTYAEITLTISTVESKEVVKE